MAIDDMDGDDGGRGGDWGEIDGGNPRLKGHKGHGWERSTAEIKGNGSERPWRDEGYWLCCSMLFSFLALVTSRRKRKNNVNYFKK